MSKIIGTFRACDAFDLTTGEFMGSTIVGRVAVTDVVDDVVNEDGERLTGRRAFLQQQADAWKGDVEDSNPVVETATGRDAFLQRQADAWKQPVDNDGLEEG